MLKALELTGFKSFADRTRFQFPAGVTVVVGPNGSGKSNVVDAMKWVLGTQSAKSLRSGEMRDVIFNGARSRKPLNAAEVTLTLDNSRGVFPHEGAEIQVTRRVYRSGETEYLLNRQPCRLRDIRDLLSSAGIANEAYGIIEQGKVDAMLQSSPHDRRAIFEEAAGINRFRAKKQEAIRRLERVEHNLLRLTDIVGEVESRLKSIRSQAGKAQRYREQADRLQKLRTQVGLADWNKFSRELAAHEAKLQQLVAAHHKQGERLAESETTATQLDANLAQLTDDIRAREAEIGKLREATAERKSLCFALAQRVETLETEVMHGRRQLLAMNARSDGREDAGRDAARQLQLAEEVYGTARTQFERIKAILDQSRQQLTAQKEQREKLRQNFTETTNKVAAAAQREQVLRSRCESSQVAGRLATDELDKLSAQRQIIAQELHDAQSREASAVELANECNVELAAAQGRLEERRRDLTASHKQFAAVEAELSRLQHRGELLEEQHRRVGRLEQDHQSLMSGSISSDGSEIFQGQVADVVHVDVDIAPMVETALGEHARDIILTAGSQLLTALANAPELSNRLVFSRLDWRHSASAVDRINLLGEPGVLGRADQFVETEEAYQPLIRRLLGRTWLVDSLETAFRMAESIGKVLHFVTEAGEHLSADGTIAVGPRAEATGLLTWRTELQSIQQQLIVERQHRGELQTQIQTLEATADLDAAEVQGRLAAHAPLAERVATLGQQRAALAERFKQLSSQLQRLAKQESKRGVELQAIEEVLTTTTAELGRWQEESQQLSADIQSATARGNEIELRYAQLQEATTDRQVAVAKAEQHLEILRSQADQHQRDQQERQQARGECHDRLQRAIDELRRQELELLMRGSIVAELCVQQELAAARVRDIYARERQLRSERNTLGQQLQRQRRELDQFASQRQNLEMTTNQIKLERRTLAQRLQEDFGIDLAAAAEQPQPELVEVDATRAELERAITDLRSSLNVIGPVNLDAIEELEALEIRFAELSAQHCDLTQAKAAIEQLLGRINNETRELFVATLETIRGHFKELFRRLFGGGEADLLLMTQPGEDVLEAGIEIAACPPGKETRTISLLSGGEKTLTCIALLLAVFRSRPSPFCILDEVDAALDESNIGRFTGVLSEFLSSTQFVVVTHSKRTMAGAQTLLGVTMQESGISKQIAVRLDDVDDQGNIRPFAPRMAA